MKPETLNFFNRAGSPVNRRLHYPSMRVRTDLVPAGTTFARNKSLEVRLARNPFEIRYAQHLRYKIFYEEMSAIPSVATSITHRDEDSYDKICDHLMVLDHGKDDGKMRRRWRKKPRVVGTYRLLRQEMAEKYDGFYTQDEFDIDALIARHGPSCRFLELGRSCVVEAYRNKPTIELLWAGIWTYVAIHELDVMIGCASLEGTDPEKLALPLSFLHHFSSPPPEWNASAHDRRRVDMNLIAKEDINPKEALRSLPPLIKGYLRIGAYIGDGAVVDHQFGTTDVLIIMPVSHIKDRVVKHFKPNELKVRKSLEGLI